VFKINIRGSNHRVFAIFQSAIKISFVCGILFTSSYEQDRLRYQEYAWFQLDEAVTKLIIIIVR